MALCCWCARRCLLSFIATVGKSSVLCRAWWLHVASDLLCYRGLISCALPRSSVIIFSTDSRIATWKSVWTRRIPYIRPCLPLRRVSRWICKSLRFLFWYNIRTSICIQVPASGQHQDLLITSQRLTSIQSPPSTGSPIILLLSPRRRIPSSRHSRKTLVRRPKNASGLPGP